MTYIEFQQVYEYLSTGENLTFAEKKQWEIFKSAEEYLNRPVEFEDLEHLVTNQSDPTFWELSYKGKHIKNIPL